MNCKIKRLLPYILVLGGAYYLLPLLMEDTGSAIFIMLAVMPMLVFCNCYLCSRRHGFQYLLVAAAALLFIPTVFIYYNLTAWIYVPVYAVIAAAGCFAGVFLH